MRKSELLSCFDGLLGCLMSLKDGFASCFHVSFLHFFFAILISIALSFSGVDGGLKVKEVGL